MPAKLSTHVLDTAHGAPAQGVQIELWFLGGDKPQLIKKALTNSDGRTDQPLLSQHEMKVGPYELIFFVGDYFAQKMAPAGTVRFLDRVPVRFGIADAGASYHVPLVISPLAYTT